MTPEDVVQEARAGALRPVYLVAGDEHFLVSTVLAELRRAVIGGFDLGLNDDQFDAAQVDADKVIAAARTLPMMAPRRLVVVRGLERWEPKGGGGAEAATAESEGSKRTTPIDRIAEYAASPSPTTTLILVAGKLDARRRLALHAKKEGYWVDCAAPSKNALPSWLARRARERQKKLSAGASTLLLEVAGPELARLDDAVERLSLFVGDGAEIDEAAVAECIVGVRAASVFELTSALGRRDLGAALSALALVYDPRERGLPLLGTLAWSTRQLMKFSGATARGLSPPEAARHAGAPPFKAGELAAQARALGPAELERWLRTLAEVDLALKGGSRRPPLAILEAAIIRLCGSRARKNPGASRSPEP